MGTQAVNDNDTIILYDQEFTLRKIKSIDLNERYITVFHERSDDEEEIVPDHFTVQVVDIDEVYVLEHGLSAQKAMTRLLEIFDESFNG